MAALKHEHSKGGGAEVAPCFVRKRDPLLHALLGLLIAASLLPAAKPELVFTELFADERSDVDPLLLDEAGSQLLLEAEEQLLSELSRHYLLLPFSMSNPAAGLSQDEAGSRVYVRALVPRADVKEQAWIGDYRVWTWQLELRLECFDVRSGQVYAGQRLTVRLPEEWNGTPPADSSRVRYAWAMQAGIEELVTRLAAQYQPGKRELVCTQRTEDGLCLLDRGSSIGITPGMMLQGGKGGDSWLYRVSRVHENWSEARLLAKSCEFEATPPFTLLASGVNQSHQGSGAQLSLSSISLPDGDVMDQWFATDALTMGQWMHDELVDQGCFRMLPPLLATENEQDNRDLATAFFKAQSAWSSFGDTGSQEIIGHRILPEGLARLTVTHAIRTVSQRIGFEAHKLQLGLLLEVLDRESGEILLSVGHEATRLEKRNDEYLRVDLEASWRELALRGIRQLAERAGRQWQPKERSILLTENTGKGWGLDQDKVMHGELGRLQHSLGEVFDRQGSSLGIQWLDYGLGRIAGSGAAAGMQVLTLVGDAEPQAGDRLLLADRPQRPLARIANIQVGGPKVRSDYEPDLNRLRLLAHLALASSERFIMLPPEGQEGRHAAEQMALASGEFAETAIQNLFREHQRGADVYVDIRLGLARWNVDEDTYRNEIQFSTGVEFRFHDPEGNPLLLFKDKSGKLNNSAKKAWTLKRFQEKSRGELVQGVLESEFPELLDECLSECLQQLGLAMKQESAE